VPNLATPIPSVRLSVCPWQVRAPRKRREMGLWLLWSYYGAYRKSPPATQGTHLQPPTTTPSPQLGLTSSQPQSKLSS